MAACRLAGEKSAGFEEFAARIVICRRVILISKVKVQEDDIDVHHHRQEKGSDSQKKRRGKEEEEGPQDGYYIAGRDHGLF